MNVAKHFTLLQLCTSIRKRIDEATGGGDFWVKAEIAGINAQRHVYLELVQHQDGVRVAVMRGIIWQHWMGGIRQALGEELNNILREGAEVLVRGRVNYHAVHGLSLHIEAVDLAYSLGEMERRKQATIATLRAEGLFDLNRSLIEPMVVQRIALITSIGSAAHADLVKHLAGNEYGYRFHVVEFPSLVQGEGAAHELRKAMGRIDPASFDAVVLIRGGGSKLDLEAFNDLELCRMVARMPIPVLTGIGHDVDVSVVDMIAKSPHKTPTAIAEHLINKCLYFETNLQGFLVEIQRGISENFTVRKERLSSFREMLQARPSMHCRSRRGLLHDLVGRLSRLTVEQMRAASKRLDHHTNDLAVAPLRRVNQVEAPRIREWRISLDQVAQRNLRALLQRVEGIREAVHFLDPEKALARGFSITRHGKVAVTDPTALQVGDQLITTFAKGRVRSTINSIEAHGRGKDDL